MTLLVTYLSLGYNDHMQYYEVLISAYQFRGTGPLSYAYQDTLEVGTIVLVPMKNKDYPAIVVRKVVKPKFTTKNISKILYDTLLPQASLRILEWMQAYYPAPISTIASLVLPANTLVRKTHEASLSTGDDAPKELTKLPPLTTEQKELLEIIDNSTQHTFLLHGDTGTGKTRVYIELINRAIIQNKSAIVLTPEISLTPQLANNIKQGISSPVYVLHSNLTQKERREIWERILYSTKPVVIIGARSALFAPIRDLGLVVIDEFHDQAYKQDQSPYYSANRVAGALAKIHQATLVFGSATPPITDYYFAKAKNIPVLRMKQLATAQDTKTSIEVIDARDRSKFVKNSYLSDPLLQAISESIRANEQSLVFLNRRGTARLVSCQNCDWQAECPNCNLPLTYHGDTHTMRCHTCGYKAPSVITCPVCKSADISYRSVGTKAIEAQLKKLYPEARIKRFDTDNLKPDKFAEQYHAILAGEVDIIVGTQLLVKGLDLPKLSVVGVAAADSSLYFPDYTAEELTYQLLSQVIGRVSRGHRNGKVIIQTNDPTGSAQIAAIDKDWDLFYSKQLAERKKYMFPPFCYLLKLTVARKSQKSAIAATEKLCQQIKKLPIQAQIIGPAPRFNEQANGNYNWQITIKSKNRANLLLVIANLPANCSYDIDPANLL
ncbi:MAG: hypothetical protein QG628_525 [Patescibacteria group bacterium]|nr:hypothetical protein [Patescibacteria group bacterium]